MSFKILFSRSAGNINRFHSLRNTNPSIYVPLINKSSTFAIQTRNHNTDGGRNGTSKHLMYLASIPTFLAFFKKKEDDDKSNESFLESLVPEDVKILLRAIPKEDEKTSEDLLKTTMKRTILCIHRQEYNKAEQMAHLALRQAQDMQHFDGITLCYDIMANLAYDLNQYEKAEKLFVSVLQRLLQKGVAQDDVQVRSPNPFNCSNSNNKNILHFSLQIIHLSLKVGHLSELQNKMDDAKSNYVWAIKKLEEKLKTEKQDEDLNEIWGLANYLYVISLI